MTRGSVAKTIEGIPGGITALALSSDGQYAAVAYQTEVRSFLAIFDTRRGVEVASTVLSSTGVAIAFSEQGQRLGVATARGDVIVRDLKGLSTPATPDDLRGRVISITSTVSKPLLPGGEPTRVAVLDFDTNGADASDGRAVAEMIRTRVGEGEKVTVVERSRIEQVLKEQLLPLSDRFDPATAVKLGKLLGANKMLIGSLNRTGSRYIVNVRLVDVEIGSIQGEREVTCFPCQAEDLQAAIIALKRVLVK